MLLSSPNGDNGGDNELSDYMRARAENIARHNARLRKLGLISTLEEKRSNAAALGQNVKQNDTKESGQCPLEKKKTKKRNRMNADVIALPSRKSLRLQGIEADIDSMKKSSIDIDDEDRSGIEKERQERVKECREVRLRAAKAIADAGAEQAAKENPTATYEHCLMRVKTMTDKGLKNRVSTSCFLRGHMITLCNS